MQQLEAWDACAVMRLFRERLLARLIDKHAVSEELARELLFWRHPGFSTHVDEPIAPEGTRALEHLAGHVVKSPLSLKRLVYVDGQLAVIYRGLRPNPTVGQNFEAMDPLEWLARMADHIPPSSTRAMRIPSAANARRKN